jgi:tetratricopeptide (TPR) repeat protein
LWLARDVDFPTGDARKIADHVRIELMESQDVDRRTWLGCGAALTSLWVAVSIRLLLLSWSIPCTLGQPPRWEEHAQSGMALLNQGRYSQAEQSYLRAIDEANRATVPDLRRSDIWNDLAKVYARQGRFDEAEALCRRALKATEDALGVEHPDAVIVILDLAVLAYERGQYVGAETLAYPALKSLRGHLDPSDPRVASGIRTLANIYSAQGRYRKAEALYRESLSLAEKEQGSEQAIHVANTMNGLGEMYLAQSRFSEFEQLYKGALPRLEPVLGSGHPAIGTALHQLGSLRYEQGRYIEAEALLHRALAVRETTVGSQSPDVARTLNNLAAVCRAQGRYEEAEVLYRRTLDIYLWTSILRLLALNIRA